MTAQTYTWFVGTTLWRKKKHLGQSGTYLGVKLISMEKIQATTRPFQIKNWLIKDRWQTEKFGTRTFATSPRTGTKSMKGKLSTKITGPIQHYKFRYNYWQWVSDRIDYDTRIWYYNSITNNISLCNTGVAVTIFNVYGGPSDSILATASSI